MAEKLVLVLTFLAVCALVNGAPSENVVKDDQNKTDKSKQLSEGKPQLTPLEQGMQPIFYITRFFLNSILQPDASGPPDVVIQSVVRIADGDTKPEQLLTQFENNWQQISQYYLGFAICIVIGLLFIIVMPVVGFCFCCCRICGNCGGNSGQMDPKFTRCKHITYTIFLLLITTIMLASVVCAFVTNDMFHSQITDKERGFVSNVNRSITGLEKYMDNTVQEMKTDVAKKVTNGIDEIEMKLNRTGTMVIDQVKVVTGAGYLLDNLTALADDVPTLIGEIDALSSARQDAQLESNNLAGSLAAAKRDIRDALTNCLTDPCKNALNRADQLRVNVDLNVLPDLDPIKRTLNKYTGLQQQIADAKADFDKVGTEMTDKIKLEIENSIKELEKAKKNVNNEMKDLEKKIANVSSQVGQSSGYLSMVPRDTMYNNIAVFAGVGLSCLFLLIVMLLYMGMTFGVCGERPYDDARFCNKGVGANFLMAGVGFMFLSSAILMLVTMILFMVGAPLQTEVCRHLKQPLESPFIDRIDTHFNIGQFLYGTTSKDKLTIKEVLTNCKNNTALYLALKFNRTYDIGASMEKTLAEMNPIIDKIVNDVKGQSFDSTIQIVPQSLKTKLGQMKNERDFNTNFDAAIGEVDKPITMDLKAYITELQLLGLNEYKVNKAMTTLRGLDESEVPALKKKMDAIKAALVSLKRVGDIPANIDKILKQIDDVQKQLNVGEQAKTMASAAELTGKKLVEDIKILANDLTDTIENDVGRCQPIYDAYDTLVTATCEDVLNPFNSFWCAYGLCLLLFIPAIIFAVKLAGLYRKTDKYVGKPFETLERTNVYPGDHIPMDERKPPPYRDGRGHGAPHSGYDNSTAPPLEYGQGMLDFEMPYAVPARKGLYPQHRDNRPLLDQPM